MDKVEQRILLFLITAIVAISEATSQSCAGCNCQLINAQALSQLVQTKVNQTIAENPLVKLLGVTMEDSRRLQPHVADTSTLLDSDSTVLAEISLSAPWLSVTSSNNLLAYRPRYTDVHNSNLAVIFINLEGVFPCLIPLTDYYPLCRTNTREGDGFRVGKALIGSGDNGDTFRIFNPHSDIVTYGIAIQGCQEMSRSCFPVWHKIYLACYLPRAACTR